MPTILETPSRARAVRFQEPPASDQDAAEGGGHEAGRDRGLAAAAGVHGARPVPCFELQEDPSFWKDHNVQVVIRVRPLSNSEISLQGYNRCVKQDSCQSITWTGHPESRFTFDLIADEHVTQEKLFKVAGVPMVENCVSGYNSCMFAYGQTGSGKTHTMLGDIEGGIRRHSVNCGMTPRVFEYLFARIQKERESRRDEKLQFTCKCSFLEIYNEQILDLLDPSSLNLQVREDAKKGIHVENLKEFEVTSARDVMQQLLQGAANRKVAATNMNRASSRSHSVFTCVIESKWESQGITHHRFSRLNLVDLAGSERQKMSGAEGERLKEATNINKSLSTLGLVIMNLVSISNKKSLHIPYRDSKLTFLLQDSLGGNAKTIIIANISPSNCCALETLSTLKFAQRAKFIRNNAIVNEEASGNVLTMRLQIQQLKKEVNRLRGLVHGGNENEESDNISSCFVGSPGSFKWEGVQGSFSPLTFDKRISQRKEYDAALVAAFRRDQDKEKALKALTAEKDAAEQLANQRTDEVQGLKMRLRFREERIKRLEAVASGKLSVESHLLQEKEELLKEIELLRKQVDRNPEVTRFAMENLCLKEELRRLQSFVEEGEREAMNEQITSLQEKLGEALDWKLMHERGLGAQDLSLSWDSSSTNEENEFHRLQAIQYQREVEALRKNLNFCLETREKLERHVDELVLQLEAERKARSATCEATQAQPTDSLFAEDQTELKTMVDAIAAASQREAEAHERAITLAKESEELRLKMNGLIEDNNKLIELYENAVSEGIADKENNVFFDAGEDQNKSFEHLNSCKDRREIEELENQLQDMHEENEKLMGLYEQAMQERDELKRLLHEQDNAQREEEICHFERLVEVDNGEICSHKGEENPDVSYPDFLTVRQEQLDLARVRLEMVHDKLSTVHKVISPLGLLEEILKELNSISEKRLSSYNDIQFTQERLASLKVIYGEMQERSIILENKLLAVKFALLNLTPDIKFWTQREEVARKKLDVHMRFVEEMGEELKLFGAQKEEVDSAYSHSTESEIQLKDNLHSLKVAYKVAEDQRKERKTVLFAIDNLEKEDISSQSAGQYGKAFELLKSEEQVTKLAAEIKKIREQIATVKKEASSSRKLSEELDIKLKDLENKIRDGKLLLEEAEMGFQEAKGEREAITELTKDGTTEFWESVLNYQEIVFLLDVIQTDVHILEEELQLSVKSVDELEMTRNFAIQRLIALLEECRYIFSVSNADASSLCTGGKLVGELVNVQEAILEARMLLSDSNVH